MEKPQITINLAPHLHDFLYHEFKRDDKEAVVLSTANDIGKYISSMVTIKDRPPKKVEMENPITLILPIQEENHYILTHNFLYIPKWKEKMIQDYLESSWKIRVREYFIVGYEKGFSQDKIISAFLLAYNIKKNRFTYDQIKKIDYRNRKKINKQVSDEIQLSLFE